VFRRAGFFHFVANLNDPLGVLGTALSAEDVMDALIVLPEAFNLGRPYGTAQDEPCACEHDWLVAKLQELARDLRITFIAGLLEPVAAGERPRSAAYLIDGDSCRTICHKATSDGTGHYKPVIDGCDIENPMEYGKACIMAVICKDIAEHRCDELTAKTEASPLEQRFICIPAAMSSSAWLYGSNLGEHINFGPPSKRRNTRIILANSLPTGPCSFITDTNWDVVALVSKQRRHQNRLILMEV